MSTLGSRIKKLREIQNIQQNEFAKKIGVSNVVLSRYESGERKPDYEILVKIADFFDVSTDYLLGRSNPPTLSEQEKFQMFANNPELECWYKELQNSNEKDLEALKQVWEIIKKNRK